MKTTAIIPLNLSQPGEYCKILSIRLNIALRRRMFDLGIIPGTVIKVLQKSPLGDPTAYRVRGSVIALRSEYTKKIIAEKI